jgi:hypothetical protein
MKIKFLFILGIVATLSLTAFKSDNLKEKTEFTGVHLKGEFMTLSESFQYATRINQANGTKVKALSLLTEINTLLMDEMDNCGGWTNTGNGGEQSRTCCGSNPSGWPTWACCTQTRQGVNKPPSLCSEI